MVDIPVWSLNEGVRIVSALNNLLPRHHFALAGGVVNNGFSYNDLDIVVLRRGDHLCYEDVWPFLQSYGFKWVECKATDVWSRWKTDYGGRKVDFLFPCRVASPL